MTQQSNGTLIIRVASDKDAPWPLPRVIDSAWDVKGAPTIEWQAIEDGADFKFLDFLADSSAFQNIQVTDKLITCDFNADASSSGHEYDIVIDLGGEEMDTQKRTGPDPGRPVIRP
jgi:hypothetical protein